MKIKNPIPKEIRIKLIETNKKYEALEETLLNKGIITQAELNKQLLKKK